MKTDYRKTINELQVKNDKPGQKLSEYKNDKKEELGASKQKINTDINDVAMSLKNIKQGARPNQCQITDVLSFLENFQSRIWKIKLKSESQSITRWNNQSRTLLLKSLNIWQTL